MIVRLCDDCKKVIIDKEELKFEVDGKIFRLAVLEIKHQNGVRWKEADYCKECIMKRCGELVIEKVINSGICLDCKNNINKATHYCKMGILKSTRKKTCKYKKES
jgi:hypothetical protein